MSEWRIYRKGVDLPNVTDLTPYVASVKVLEYRGTFLEDTQVTFDISSPAPISLAYGDKMMYRGEMFVLRDPLSVEKVARRNSYGGAFKYENITFRGLEWEMQNVEFTDIVPSDNEEHYTGLSTFSFYCDHPQKLIERIQECMDVAYVYDEAWTIELADNFDAGSYAFTPQSISVSSGTSCWSALSLLYKNWKIPFTRTGRTITVGASVQVTSTVEYGKGNGLMSIKRVPDSDVRVITRLRAYGSSKNMPYRYYNNKGFINDSMYMPYLMLPMVREEESGDGHDIYLLSDNVLDYGIIDGEIHFDGSGENEEIYPTLEGMTTDDARISSVTYDNIDKRLDRIISAVNPADNGICEDGDYDSDDAVDTDGAPIVKEFTMTIPYLGFDWSQKLTSEGQAKIIMKSGMCATREFTVLEVTPVSSSDVTRGSVLRMERINDDVTGYVYPNSTWTINGGDYYVITGIEMDDVYVIAAENRLLTAAQAFLAENDHPNYKYEPQINNIWMQEHPSDAAKMKPGVKLSFRDDDLNISSGIVTIQTVTIDEGKRPLPEYQVVLNDNVSTTTLEQLTAQVDAIMSGNYGGGGGGISQSELMAQIRNVGSSLFLSKNSADTASGLIRFLQGIVSQGQAQLQGGATFGTQGSYGVTLSGDATFDEIFANDFSLAGSMTVGGEINAQSISTEVLTARAAHFAQLIIDELRAAGGAYLLSAADCTIDYVEMRDDSVNRNIVTENPSFYRCYYKANDGERAIIQKWERYDQAMHTSFNSADEGENYDVSNRYYWIVVDAVSAEPVEITLEDGNAYPCHWIDLDVRSTNTRHEDSNANPEVGDNIVLLGHRGTYSARRSAIFISAYSNSFDSEVNPPAIVFYQNINSFDLSAANGKKPNYWGRDKVVVTGQLFYTSDGGQTSTDVSTLVGADNYSFSVDKPYQQYSGSGDLSYQMKMTKNGRMVPQANVEEYLARGTASGCSISGISTQNATVTITPNQGVTSGNATIACYTSATHSTSTLWGYVTLSFSKVDVPELFIDQYAFYLEQDTKTVTCSGTSSERTITPSSLQYTVKLEVDGNPVNAGPYIEVDSLGGVNCDVGIDANDGTKINLTNLGKTDKTVGGSGTIYCYTDTTHETLWGVLTAKFNVSWSTFAFNIVDGQLASKADNTTVNALGDRVSTAETKIQQNADDIELQSGRIDDNETDISNLQIQADNISASVASQKYNSNLFGFTNGLSFTDTCVPFIQAYGVEFVGTGTGTVSGFGGISMDAVTVSGLIRSMGNSTTATMYVNGTTAATISVTTSWTEFQFTFTGTTNTPLAALNSISLRYTTSGTDTVAVRNLKVESGKVATAFCISDSDGTEIENTNMFTTTVEYNRDPIYNKINANEVMDTSGADGHGNVLTFYRSNSSDPFMVYNDYIGWPEDPANVRTKVFTAGKVYTISFCAKSAANGLKIHTGLYGHVTTAQEPAGASYTSHNSGAYYSDKSTDGIYDNGGCENIHTLTTSWKRYYARFYIKTGVTAVPIIQCNNGLSLGTNTSKYLYIADVRLEEGYIADDSDPMSISGAQTRSEARFSMTADNIELKLNETGININDKTITLDADRTSVRGELQANKVLTTNNGLGWIDMTDGMMKVFNNNGVGQIQFGVDNEGNIVLQYFDKTTGKKLWDLGPEGIARSASQDERIVTYEWCMMKTWNNINGWQQVGLDNYDTQIQDIETPQYMEIQNGASESYIAYLIHNGIAAGKGYAYQYEAKINAGQYVAGNLAVSADVARAYDKIYLRQIPTSGNKLTVDGGGDTTSTWTAGFIRIVSIQRWLTASSMAEVTQVDGKYYCIPDDYDTGGYEHGTDVTFELEYRNFDYYYKDPPIYFLIEGYEYGVLRERGVWYINSSKIEGL